MQEWISRIISSPELNIMILPALFLLGVISAVGSFGCSIPMIGLIAGYAGTRENTKKRDGLLIALSFMFGTIISLTLIGYIIGVAGEVVGGVFRQYSRIIAGLMAVFFGLMTLNLVPVKLPELKYPGRKLPAGLAGAVALGFVMGGVTAACTLTCCSPVLPMLFGITGLQGNAVKSAVMMGIFSIGFSIPLTAVLLGLSFGKWSLRASRAMPVIKVIAGVLLLVVGFYFLSG